MERRSWTNVEGPLHRSDVPRRRSVFASGESSKNHWRSGVLVVVCFATLAMSMSEGRELRPTEHGLEFQNNVTESETGGVPEMQAFFDGKKNSRARFPMPEAKDPSHEEWWREVTSESKGPSHKEGSSERGFDGGDAGLRHRVALLVVPAVLFLIQSRKQKYTIPTSK